MTAARSTPALTGRSRSPSSPGAWLRSSAAGVDAVTTAERHRLAPLVVLRCEEVTGCPNHLGDSVGGAGRGAFGVLRDKMECDRLRGGPGRMSAPAAPLGKDDHFTGRAELVDAVVQVERVVELAIPAEQVAID